MESLIFLWYMLIGISIPATWAFGCLIAFTIKKKFDVKSLLITIGPLLAYSLFILGYIVFVVFGATL